MTIIDLSIFITHGRRNLRFATTAS